MRRSTPFADIAELDSETGLLRVGSLLVQGLAEGLTNREAFERARPGNDTVLFWRLLPQVARAP